MRYLPILLLIALIMLPQAADARGAVILVIDGLGSSYLAGHAATYASGASIDPIHMRSFDMADARYQLEVPVPETEYGHAVIVTGYRNVSPEEVSGYHATVFDALHDGGFIAMGILENGDSTEMLGELDVAVHVTNNSIYSPDIAIVKNSQNVPDVLTDMMRGYPPLSKVKAGKDPYAPYERYNSWALDFTRDTVAFMNSSAPQLDYVLIVNAGGLDSAGQNLGYDGYEAVLTAMDDDVQALVDTCRRSGTILMITGDHGMSFPDGTKKGSHANAASATRSESLLAPLLIYSNGTPKDSGTYGQECLAPTLLELLDEPNTLSMSDGEPLPVKEKPSLFLISKEPVSVTITGPGLNKSVEFNGTCRLSGLAKGEYVILYAEKREAVRLDHDVVLDVRKDGPSTPGVPPWAAYGIAALVSTVGIVAALKLTWGRR